jgi:hypothetical protein
VQLFAAERNKKPAQISPTGQISTARFDVALSAALDELAKDPVQAIPISRNIRGSKPA